MKKVLAVVVVVVGVTGLAYVLDTVVAVSNSHYPSPPVITEDSTRGVTCYDYQRWGACIPWDQQPERHQ